MYNAKIEDIENKIHDITNLYYQYADITNAALVARINEVKGEIHSITDLATTSALNAKVNEIKSKILSFN